MPYELGETPWFVTANNFLNQTKYPKENVIRRLKRWTDTHQGEETGESQIRAWKNCYDVLQHALKSLSIEQRRFYLVFEYVLPLHDPASFSFIDENHLRADVTLVSRDNVLVLEFKDRDDSYEGLFKAAEKYKKRYENFHVESRGKKIESILVQTLAHDLVGAKPGFTGDLIKTCSPDHLAEAIAKEMGNQLQYPIDMKKWVESEFHR